MSHPDPAPAEQTQVVDKVVLESYLRKLHLSAFVHHHEVYAMKQALRHE